MLTVNWTLTNQFIIYRLLLLTQPKTVTQVNISLVVTMATVHSQSQQQVRVGKR